MSSRCAREYCQKPSAVVPESPTKATSVAIAMRRSCERVKLLLLTGLGDVDAAELLLEAAVQEVGGAEESEREDRPQLTRRQAAGVGDHHGVVCAHHEGEDAHVAILPLIGLLPDE